MAKRIPDNHYDAGALHIEIPLDRFITETVFHTKSGAFGQVIRISGIDPEYRLDDDLQNYSRRTESALEVLDPRFRLYQYVIKRFRFKIPSRGNYTNPRAAEFTARRVRDLSARHQHLAGISIYFVILFEGNEVTRQLRNYLGISANKSIRQLKEEDIRSIETLTSTVNAFTKSLDDMLGFEALEEDRAKLFFRSLMNPDPLHAEHFHSEPGQRLDYAVVDTSVKPQYRHLLFDEYYVSAATVKLPPRNPRPSAIISQLSRTDCDFIAVMEYKPQHVTKMRKLIKSRKKTFVAQGISMIQAALAGAWTPKHEMPKKEDVDFHADKLGECLVSLEEDARYGAFSCTILLLGTDHHRVRNAHAELVRVYGQANTSLVKESLNLWSAHLAIIPGNVQRNHSYSYILASDFANLCFLWQSWLGNPVNKHLKDEYLCLYETRDQQLFYFNGHVGGVYGVQKLGAPESGKSFDTVYQLLNLAKFDPVTLILDIGGGYRDATSYLGGEYFEISKAHQASKMNPLSLPDTHENKQFLTHFLKLLFGKDETLKPDQAARDNDSTYNAVCKIYKLHPKDRRLSNLNLPAHLAVRLKRWCQGGQYGHVFDNPEDTIRFTNLQTFEFQGMEKETDLLVPLCFYITQRFNQVIYDETQISRLKVLVIDEAWRWMLTSEMGAYMVDKLKTGRKHNLCNMFITQSGLDTERASQETDRATFGELLNEACPTKIFFHNPDIRPQTYQVLYGLNDKQAQAICQLKPREELAIYATDPARPAAKQFKIVRLQLDDAEDRLLCSNDPAANQIRMLRRMATA